METKRFLLITLALVSVLGIVVATPFDVTAKKKSDEDKTVNVVNVSSFSLKTDDIDELKLNIQNGNTAGGAGTPGKQGPPGPAGPAGTTTIICYMGANQTQCPPTSPLPTAPNPTPEVTPSVTPEVTPQPTPVEPSPLPTPQGNVTNPEPVGEGNVTGE